MLSSLLLLFVSVFLPAYARNVESYLHLADGSYLYIQEWPTCALKQPAGVVIFLHDLGECSGMYDGLFYRLNRVGLAVITFDLRGHGLTLRGGELPCRVIYESEAGQDQDTRDALRCVPRPARPPIELLGTKLLSKSVPINTRELFCQTKEADALKAVKMNVCAQAPQGSIGDFQGFSTTRTDIDSIIRYLICTTGESAPIVLMGQGVGGLMALDYLHQGSLRQRLSAAIVASPSLSLPALNNWRLALQNYLSPIASKLVQISNPSECMRPEASDFTPNPFQTDCVTIKGANEILQVQDTMLSPQFQFNCSVPVLIASGDLDCVSPSAATKKFVTQANSSFVGHYSSPVGLHLLHDSCPKALSAYVDFLVKHLNECPA